MNERHFKFLQWTPAVVSVVLMVLIAVVSVRTVSALKKATFWREHTFQVILDAQTLEDKLLDAQSGIDQYATAGTDNLLVEYRNDTNVETREFSELTRLTRDNPEQQRRLRELSAAVKAIFDYDNRIIAIYGQKGSQAAVQAENGIRERQILDPAVKDLENIKDEEEILLEKRDAAEQKGYHKTAWLLIVGSTVASVLLVFSNFFTGREMSRRRCAETKQRELIEQLQKSLSEVKTLSGLIPICGWCKNVRSDTGYWQSVEQYVRSHTDATFSHGMCPACAKKWDEDMAQISKS